MDGIPSCLRENAARAVESGVLSAVVRIGAHPTVEATAKTSRIITVSFRIAVFIFIYVFSCSLPCRACSVHRRACLAQIVDKTLNVGISFQRFRQQIKAMTFKLAKLAKRPNIIEVGDHVRVENYLLMAANCRMVGIPDSGHIRPYHGEIHGPADDSSPPCATW